AALFNGFWWVADVAGSTWFVVMMGAEMGALVVFKLRETRVRELRARLALTLGAYAAFTVFFPGFLKEVPVPGRPELAQVPLVGWSMGLGTGGPVAPEFFSALLLT